MNQYALPSAHIHTYKQLQVQCQPSSPTEITSFALAKYLGEIKEKITEREKEWDMYKKYTNTYEYIHSMVPHKKRAVSKYKPLSRSYFKMLELIHQFELLHKSGMQYNKYLAFSNKHNIQSFHLAEGPGGFIEAVVNTRNNPSDVYVGMTIVDDKHDGTIPSWSKSDYFLKQHPNIQLEYGQDQTGNILSIDNFQHCVFKYGSSMDVITADGGFDFSVNFNHQEVNMASLLFAQICYALCLQKKGGNFVLKLFDCFYAHTIDMLYLLSSFYQNVYITKPQTSRSGNAEKYVVCKGFYYDTHHLFYPFIKTAFETMMSGHNQEWYLHRILNTKIPYYFVMKVNEYNAVFGQQQLENIHYTISLIEKNVKSDKLNHMLKSNISKCINWCMKHNVPYNNLTYSSFYASDIEEHSSTNSLFSNSGFGGQLDTNVSSGLEDECASPVNTGEPFQSHYFNHPSTFSTPQYHSRSFF